MWYEFFNNSTVAAVIAVLVASWIASWQYGKQKNIGRDSDVKKDIIYNLNTLQGKTHSVNIIIDRIANTRQYVGGDTPEFREAIKYESPELSNIINDLIPHLISDIKNNLNLYFVDNKIIIELCKNLRTKLKDWHDPIVKMQVDLTEKSKQQQSLLLNELDKTIKDLISAIWEEKISL